MTVKSTRTTFGASVIALALGGTALVVPTAGAQNAEESTAPQCETVVTGGTFNWGLKESFRSYIQGPIARGGWATKGDVKESDPENPKAKDFQFQYEIDPAKSTIEIDDEGNVTSADLHTKDSEVIFEGHHGALYSNFQSPYVEVTGNDVQGGAGYEGYYVEGKPMTQYTPEDRTDENKRTGADVFSKGDGEWQVNGDTITLDATNMTYVPKPGTDPDKSIVEGVDILFMGIYSAEYKPELDDINISLTTEEKCVTPESTTSEEPTSEDPTSEEPTSEEPTSEEPTSEKPAKPTASTSKPAETTSAEPTKTEAPDEDEEQNKDEEQGSSLMTKFGSVWNYVLGGLGILGMFGIIGHALNVAGVFGGIQKQFNKFLRQFNLR